MPSAWSGLRRSLSAASSPADSRLGGWISTSSVRRSRTPWRSVDIEERSAPAALAVPAALGVLGQRREAERHARDVLDDAVVQVGRDAAALLGGGLDRVGEQGLAVAVPALQAPRHRPGERHLEEEQHGEAGEQRERELDGEGSSRATGSS